MPPETGISMKNQEIIQNAIMLLKLCSANEQAGQGLQQAVEGKKEFDALGILMRLIETRRIFPSTPVFKLLDAYRYAQRVVDCCEEGNIKISVKGMETFPDAFDFPGGPPLIYYRGEIDILKNPDRAAVIGTRYPVASGRNFAYRTGKLLAQHGYTVISGLAQGSDAAAHEGCLEEGGKTVAFLPSNIKTIYPRSNAGLAERIVEGGGVLVSTYSPLKVQTAEMYIKRDRLQAGTARMLFAAEFGENSGTLQTIRFAHELHRPVYTLDKLLKLSDFKGYREAESMNIQITPLSWDEIKTKIEDRK